jgi:hypothetical protein
VPEHTASKGKRETIGTKMHAIGIKSHREIDSIIDEDFPRAAFDKRHEILHEIN